MDETDELSIREISDMLGLAIATPRAWVTTGKLEAHKDPGDQRKWLVYRRDLDAFLSQATRPDIGRPKGRGVVEATSREDWSDAPQEATLDLTSSVQLPGRN